MDELIGKAARAAGLDVATAERAVGIVLSLVRAQGDQRHVGALFSALPGAAALADRHGGDGAAGGGMLNRLGGGLMGAPLAAVAKLQSAGLSMDQVHTIGRTVLDHAKREAGEDLVRDTANSIPGLSKYLK